MGQLNLLPPRSTKTSTSSSGRETFTSVTFQGFSMPSIWLYSCVSFIVDQAKLPPTIGQADFIEMFYNPVKRHSHTDGVSLAKFGEAYVARREGV